MKVSNVDSSILITDFENVLNVYENDDIGYFYNLNEGLYINVDESNLEEYVLKTNAFWTLISLLLYNTTRLAWLLMKLNDVRGLDIFKMKYAGDKIKYLPVSTVNSILKQL